MDGRVRLEGRGWKYGRMQLDVSGRQDGRGRPERATGREKATRLERPFREGYKTGVCD